MGNNKIHIHKTFNEQYTLFIEMDSQLVNASMQSKASARYDFSIINVSENDFECRLVQLEHNLLESNNDYIKEVSRLTSSFGKMFNELHLKLSHKAEILDVLNLELIQAKWNQTKKEMQEVANTNEDLKKLLKLNDELFVRPDKIKAAIKASEFIQIYFSHYFDVVIPSHKYVKGTNILNTANIEWDISLSKKNSPNQSPNIVTFISEGKPWKLNKEFYKSAYRAFSDKIDLANVSTKLHDNVIFQMDLSSGRLIKSITDKAEFVTPELYNKIKYTLVCDEIYLKELNAENQNERPKETTLPPNYVNLFDL